MRLPSSTAQSPSGTPPISPVNTGCGNTYTYYGRLQPYLAGKSRPQLVPSRHSVNKFPISHSQFSYHPSSASPSTSSYPTSSSLSTTVTAAATPRTSPFPFNPPPTLCHLSRRAYLPDYCRHASDSPEEDQATRAERVYSVKRNWKKDWCLRPEMVGCGEVAMQSGG